MSFEQELIERINADPSFRNRIARNLQVWDSAKEVADQYGVALDERIPGSQYTIRGLVEVYNTRGTPGPFREWAERQIGFPPPGFFARLRRKFGW